ncbi:hypothetical protein Cci01nite_81400 [Catellatospora citrea]|uniref:TIR domain-containing protein n=1 Tax=Catellatospora citrea TaxID=53366 RepID=A0A8J3P459_9ACTN|nr:TIR domain-containing protein [Catellatospora citrea]GIG03047.1 hypothetical protein Cci01nite_81400 [Catellatospora citrea]
MPEAAGYTVIIQAWDFRPGNNFALEMQKALEQCERAIAVLSPDYLTADFPQPDWAAKFVADPRGTERLLLPIMVRECEPGGLLGPVVQIRVHKLDSEAAVEQAILDGVKEGRAKPETRPAFPGGPAPAGAQRPGAGLRWQRVADPVQVSWRADLDGSLPHQQRREAVELHLVPVGDEARLQVRELTQLRDVLPDFGRSHRMFSPVEALQVHADATVAAAVGTTYDNPAGIAVTRTGQRSVWAALPPGRIGAILDEEHLAGQLQAMLRALVALAVPAADLVVPAVAIEPAQMLTVGKAAGPHGNTAALGGAERLRPAHEDAVKLPDLGAYAAAVGEELAARLVAEHRSSRRY